MFDLCVGIQSCSITKKRDGIINSIICRASIYVNHSKHVAVVIALFDFWSSHAELNCHVSNSQHWFLLRLCRTSLGGVFAHIVDLTNLEFHVDIQFVSSHLICWPTKDQNADCNFKKQASSAANNYSCMLLHFRCWCCWYLSQRQWFPSLWYS